MMLPSPTTEESRMRLELSQRLCQACPVPLGREIAVTGSVARGTADAASDLELNAWVDDLPPADVRRDWLQSVGGTDIVLDREETGDGTVWSHVHFHGVLVEIGWQPLAAVPQEVDALLRGEVTDHRALLKAWVIEHAVPLRSRGAIGQWKHRLACYPDAVEAALIADACDAWRFRHILDSGWSLARRGERLAVTGHVCRDVQNVLRVLFALNRRWEPDWKWMEFVTRDLRHVPIGFHERVARALAEEGLSRKVAPTLELVADTLALVSERHDVSGVAASVRRSLEEHRPG